MDAHNYFKFSPYESIPDESQHDFKFTMSQIQADMRDVAFYFNKKTGLPKMKDSGLADVFVGGEGLTIKVHITGAGKDQSSVFKVKDVHCKVDSLKFSVRDVCGPRFFLATGGLMFCIRPNTTYCTRH